MKFFLLLLTALSVLQTTLAADPYWILQDESGNEIGQGKKCPYDNTRLFKYVSNDPDPDVYSCYEKCKSIQNCKHISYGMYDNKWMCMGCNGHEYGYDNHAPFTVYEIEARDDWAFTKVAAKRECGSQRYGDPIPGITQAECHTRCKDTQGCGYFSMSDMTFNPTGSGTCQLCKWSDGFSSQSKSNTYSILSPADYRPVCEGPTGVVWGDPHFITFDKLRYDCQGRGEYVLVKSNGPDPLAIHGVFEDTGGSATGPSVTRSVAILVDENVPVLQITIPDMPDANGKCDFSYTIGENEIEIAADQIVQYFMQNYPGEANVYTNEKAVVVTFPDYQTRIEILVHSGHFSRFGCRMRANVCVTPQNHGGDIVGLFGSPNNDKTDDWMTNATSPSFLTVPVNDRSKLRSQGTGYCREHWCVPRQNSLYGDSTYTAHNKCADDSFDPDAYENMINALPDNIKAMCNEIAENPDECIADVAVLNAMAEEAGEDVDLVGAVQGFGGEEQDSNKVSSTREAELYAEDDWTSPNVTTLNTLSTVASSINNGLVPEITITVSDEEGPNPDCPVCKSKGWGDPHIVTFDGVTYDVHVIGELTFLKSLSTDFEIQARTEIVENHPKGPAVTTAVVVHEDSSKYLPVVQVSLARPVTGPSVGIANCPVQMFVNGEYRDITTGTGFSNVTVQVKRNRIVLEYPSTDLRLDIQVRTWRNTCHFSVNYILSDCRCDETLVGILGQPDGEPYNDWHDHTGTAVEIPSSKKERRTGKAYDYSLTWCLENAVDSHFTYEGGNSFSTFDKCNPDQYDDTLDEIIDNATPEQIANCTIDGEVDYGCIIECDYFGEEACDEYKEVIKNTETAVITAAPTSAPTSAPTDELDLSTNENGNTFDDVEDVDATDTEEIVDPPADAGSKGDPHFKTWKNEHFEYHSQCDLVLAHHPTFADGIGLEVQIRTKLVRFWSYIRSAAIRIGDDILEVQGTADEANTLRYWYNLEYQKEITSVGGFPITMKKSTGRFMKNRFIIDLDSKYPGQKIQITTWKEFVAVDFMHASFEAYGKSVGMLGDYKTGETLSRDGSIIHDFHEFGDEWQVRPTDDMLFHDVEKPQFPTKCMIPEDPQGERRRRLDESSVTEEQAEAACARLTDPLDRKDCVYDILATQDTTMAGAY